MSQEGFDFQKSSGVNQKGNFLQSCLDIGPKLSTKDNTTWHFVVTTQLSDLCPNSQCYYTTTHPIFFLFLVIGLYTISAPSKFIRKISIKSTNFCTIDNSVFLFLRSWEFITAF